MEHLKKLSELTGTRYPILRYEQKDHLIKINRILQSPKCPGRAMLMIS
jgi:hypothetical protein